MRFASIALLLLASCGEPATPLDAGFDAPIVDAPVAPSDTPPAPECMGTPTACSTLENATCDTVQGCALTTCRGFPVACSMLTMEECATQAGCSWSGTCTGTALPCGALAPGAECAGHLGCTMGIEGCGGLATPCERLSRAECTAQPGCSVGPVDAPRDAASSGEHYSLCTTADDCPSGDLCDYEWPAGAGPVPEPPPPSYCQPPCTVDADCMNDAYDVPGTLGMCTRGRCYLYCAVGGLVPTCAAPYQCAYYDPSDPRDGYCVLP